MLTSMTGFGRSEVGLSPTGRAMIEIHTLNHRFLELECRLPEELEPLQAEVRALVAQQIRRGRVKVSVTVKAQAASAGVGFQAAVAKRYVKELRHLQRQLRLAGEVTLQMVVNLPKVATVAEPQEGLGPRHWKQLKAGLLQTLLKAHQMRRQEGRRLEGELRRLAKRLKNLQEKVRRRAPTAQQGLRQRFLLKVEKLPLALDPKVLTSEAASFVQGTDVTEELARIGSHLVALSDAIEGRGETPGRRMEFLSQELHREINTLGAKSRDGQISHWVVEMKGQVEKLREQAANVE